MAPGTAAGSRRTSDRGIDRTVAGAGGGAEAGGSGDEAVGGEVEDGQGDVEGGHG